MRKIAFPFLLLVLLCFPLFDLFHAGLPMTHDGVDHVARIANFYQSLREGNVIPRWAANLNWGYGHPILMFLYPLPSYLASFFHLIGASFVDSTKLVFGISYVLSGLAMYFYLSAFLNRKAAFLGALVYAFSPYRFVDMYVRGALGEHVAFIFPPLVCLAIYRIAERKKTYSFLLGFLSIAGLLLAHNAISLMFLPLFALYAVYLYCCKNRSFSFLGSVFLLFVVGFLLAAFFWLPAFFEGKYTLRDIVTNNEYLSRFETWQRFMYSPWSYGGTGEFSVQIGLAQWVGIALLPVAGYLFYRIKNSLWIVCIGLFTLFFVILFIMTKDALPLWHALTILQKFQFPWRFLSVIVFIVSIAIALIIQSVKGKRSFGLVVLFAVIILGGSFGEWHAKGYVNYPSSFYSGIYQGTTDTGESAPIWSVRFMEQSPTDPSSAINGQADIKTSSRSTTMHAYRIVTEEPTRIVENTLYFPGWEVLVNGKQVPLEFQDPAYRGLMTYMVPKGTSTVLIAFHETRLRYAADIISVVAFVLVFGYAVYLLFRSVWQRYP